MRRGQSPEVPARASGTPAQPCPLADGGEGTLDAVLEATGGQRHLVDTVDALGRPMTSAWGMLPDGTAVVEAATSVGLALLGEDRDPIAASSAGLGRVLASALARQPRRLVIAVRGVATSDGGLGCLDEIGWDLGGVPTVVACDMETHLLDTAKVFSLHKGANSVQIAILTRAIRGDVRGRWRPEEVSCPAVEI